MSAIFGFLGLLVFAALIIGLAKPKLILRWSNKPTRLKVIVLCIIIMAFISIFSSFTESPEKKRLTSEKSESENIPKYSIIEKTDISSSGAKRLRVRASVDILLNKDEITAICNDIIEKGSYKRNKIKAVQFYFYLPNTDTRGEFTAAHAEWAPNGVWADAARLQKTDYSKYQFKIEIASKIVWEDKTGLSIEKKRDIYFYLVVVQDSLNNANIKDANRKSYKIIAKKFNISLNDAEEIAGEGLTRSWPIP